MEDFPDDDDYTSEGDVLSQSMNMPSRQEPCKFLMTSFSCLSSYLVYKWPIINLLRIQRQ